MALGVALREYEHGKDLLLFAAAVCVELRLEDEDCQRAFVNAIHCVPKIVTQEQGNLVSTCLLLYQRSHDQVDVVIDVTSRLVLLVDDFLAVFPLNTNIGGGSYIVVQKN